MHAPGLPIDVVAPTLQTPSLLQDPKHLRPGVSRLTAALDSLNATGQDGHIIARADSKSYPRRTSQLEASISASSASLSAQQAAYAQHHASDVNRLVTHAKRLSKPAADMVSVQAAQHWRIFNC